MDCTLFNSLHCTASLRGTETITIMCTDVNLCNTAALHWFLAHLQGSVVECWGLPVLQCVTVSLWRGAHCSAAGARLARQQLIPVRSRAGRCFASHPTAPPLLTSFSQVLNTCPSPPAVLLQSEIIGYRLQSPPQLTGSPSDDCSTLGQGFCSTTFIKFLSQTTYNKFL